MPRYLPSLAALIISAGPVLSAPAADGVPTDVETTVVTATRSAVPLSRTNAVVVVIDAGDIAASGAASLPEILRGRAGIEVLDFYGDGSRSNIGLRGFGENAASNTLVLLDGQALNNPDIGAPDLGRIALADIERIEIMHGGNAWHGDQAVGGVISITTRSPEQPTAGIELSAGSHASADIRADLQQIGANWSAGLFARSEQRDNYRAHNELQRRAAGARGQTRLSDFKFNARLDYSEERLQTPGALFDEERREDRRQSAADFSKDYSDLDTLLAGVDVDWRPGDVWSTSLSIDHRDVDGDFRLSFRGFQSEPAAQARRVDTLRLHARRSLHAALRGSFAFGADVRRSDYRLRSQFGQQSNAQQLDDAWLGVTLGPAAGVELSAALRHSSIEDELRDSGEFASLPDGRRITHSRTLGSFGIGWQSSEHLRLFAAWDQVIRYPKVDEYFGSGFTPDTIGLRPQSGTSVEFGLNLQTSALRLTALLWQLQLADEIVFDPASFANTNIDRSTRQGVLIDASVELPRNVLLQLSWSLTDAELSSGDLQGRAIPLVAKQHGRAALDWRPSGPWSVRLEWLADSERVLAGDFDNTLAPLPGYGVINLSTSWRPNTTREGLSVQARIDNLLGREYETLGIASSPPPEFDERAAFFPLPVLNARLTLAWRW